MEIWDDSNDYIETEEDFPADNVRKIAETSFKMKSNYLYFQQKGEHIVGVFFLNWILGKCKEE